MHILARLLLFFSVGVALAYSGMLLIGWFAAIAWDRDTYLQVANNPALRIIVLSVAMAALPVALMATLAGFVVSEVATTAGGWPIGVLSLPWIALLLIPSVPNLSFSVWIDQYLADPHAVLVLIAMPVGLFLGFMLSRSKTRTGAA